MFSSLRGGRRGALGGFKSWVRTCLWVHTRISPPPPYPFAVCFQHAGLTTVHRHRMRRICEDGQTPSLRGKREYTASSAIPTYTIRSNVVKDDASSCLQSRTYNFRSPQRGGNGSIVKSVRSLGPMLPRAAHAGSCGLRFSRPHASLRTQAMMKPKAGSKRGKASFRRRLGEMGERWSILMARVAGKHRF